MEIKRCKVSQKFSGERTDVFLATYLGLSRSQIKRLIQDKKPTVNGTEVKASYCLDEGDIVSFFSKPIFEKNEQSIDFKQKILNAILYEDEAILVLNKPVGIVVHPVVDFEKNVTVMQILNAYTELSLGESPLRRGVVHRLDKYTEGLMLFAKKQSAYLSLKSQFMERKVVKRYYAMVRGNVIADNGVLSYPIAKHAKRRHEQAVCHRYGKPAETYYSVLKHYNTKTLLDVEIKTGRKHQIRVHFSFIGHPIMGDYVYGEEKNKKTGFALQSYYLEFFHPCTGDRMRFILPISRGFRC